MRYPSDSVTDPDGRVARLLAAVEEHRPYDEREYSSQEEIRIALRTLPHPFDRNAHRIHLTASAVVIGSRGVLLHRHRNLGRWLQPGGHFDPGETPLEAAVRETLEETGIHARPLANTIFHIDCHEAGGHRHLDIRYLLDGGAGDPAPPPGESPDVRWFPWDEAMQATDESLRGALRQLEPA